MKKFLLFAVAMLSLVACKKNNGDEPKVPARQVTIHATVYGGKSANGPARIAPADPTAATVIFEWEEGDVVYLLSNDESEIQEFTLIPGTISQDGQYADFTGTELVDMSNYMVLYGGEKDYMIFFSNDDYEINYIENSFKPAVYGFGDGDSFVLDQFGTVIKLQLTGEAKLGKIEYVYTKGIQPSVVTMNMGDGLQLTSTPKVVYFPVFKGEAQTSFKFYDTDNQLIMEKSINHDFQEDAGSIVTMPVLEVKAAATPDPKDIFVDNNTFELVFTDKNNVYYITYVYTGGLFTCQKVLVAERDEPEETEDMTNEIAPYLPVTKTTGNTLTFNFGEDIYVDIDADANPATCLFRSLEPLNHPELWGVQQINVNDVDITDQFTMSRDIPNENE